MRVRDIIGSLGVMGVVIAAFPLAISLAGSRHRRELPRVAAVPAPNHDWIFYPTTVPVAIGLLVVARPWRGSGCFARAPGEGDAAPVLDRGAGLVLPGLARQGLPVPAADRSRRRGPWPLGLTRWSWPRAGGKRGGDLPLLRPARRGRDS